MTVKSTLTPELGGEARREADRVLAKHPIFSALDSMDRAFVLDQCEPVHLPRGHVLFREGALERFAYILLSGEVHVFVDVPGGGPIHMARIADATIIGEIAAFSDLPRTATVIARTPVSLLRLDRSNLSPIISRSPDVAYRVISVLGHRLQQINRPLALMTYAVHALEQDEFDPGMLAAVAEEEGSFRNFAAAFNKMATEIRNKRSQRADMEAAARIQRSIIPDHFKHYGDKRSFDIYAEMRPAKEVGGDFYDHFMLDDRRLAFVIADVSGKGVPASLFMAVARTTLRAKAPHAASAEDCITQANRQIGAENHASMFVTLFYGELDVETGRFRYVNAGHNDVFLLTDHEPPQPLAPTGLAIGFMDDFEYSAVEMQLTPGDAIFCYTDGVTEAFDRDQNEYGEQRLIDLLTEVDHSDADKLVRGVIDSVQSFANGAEQSDDITCLAVCFGREDGEPTA